MRPTAKVPRNALCPCGSGLKYKRCCHGKSFEWVQAPDGTFSRQVQLDDDALALLQQQHDRFVETFGREPGSDDPVFFDAPPFEHFEHDVVETMKRANMRPEIIHAFQKTGLLVGEDNLDRFTTAQLAEWAAAVDEYRTLHEDA